MAKKKRTKKQAGGPSMMVPPERKAYAEGSTSDYSDDMQIGVRSQDPEQNINNYLYMENKIASLPKGKEKDFLKAELKMVLRNASRFINVSEREFSKLIDAERQKRKSREQKQEGGSMLVPPEMEMEAPEAPVDTYPNIPPEEMAEVEASQLPDQEMEDDYVDFVMNEALDPEEQTYLMNALEADPQLSIIFDKVVDTASEFSGAGEVNGPGDGVSDSIPARLSDGEFVVTKKATDQIGADNLQTMMDEAERAFDGGLMEKDRGIEDEEIRKSMVASNQMPSLNVRQR